MRQLELCLLAGVATLMLLAGCSKATPENFEKIQVGMKKADVHGHLGKPSKVEGAAIGPASLYFETWDNPPIHITITFEGDTVAMKTISGDKTQ
jgi:hypothetical protein